MDINAANNRSGPTVNGFWPSGLVGENDGIDNRTADNATVPRKGSGRRRSFIIFENFSNHLILTPRARLVVMIRFELHRLPPNMSPSRPSSIAQVRMLWCVLAYSLCHGLYLAVSSDWPGTSCTTRKMLLALPRHLTRPKACRRRFPALVVTVL